MVPHYLEFIAPSDIADQLTEAEGSGLLQLKEFRKEQHYLTHGGGLPNLKIHFSSRMGTDFTAQPMFGHLLMPGISFNSKTQTLLIGVSDTERINPEDWARLFMGTRLLLWLPALDALRMQHRAGEHIDPFIYLMMEADAVHAAVIALRGPEKMEKTDARLPSLFKALNDELEIRRDEFYNPNPLASEPPHLQIIKRSTVAYIRRSVSDNRDAVLLLSGLLTDKKIHWDATEILERLFREKLPSRRVFREPYAPTHVGETLSAYLGKLHTLVMGSVVGERVVDVERALLRCAGDYVRRGSYQPPVTLVTPPPPVTKPPTAEPGSNIIGRIQPAERPTDERTMHTGPGAQLIELHPR